MTKKVIKFPSQSSRPVTVPADFIPARIIILPVVRIERNPDPTQPPLPQAACNARSSQR